MAIKNKIINLCEQMCKQRCKIKNTKNGRAYMEAFLTNKKLSCFLREGYK